MVRRYLSSSDRGGRQGRPVIVEATILSNVWMTFMPLDPQARDYLDKLAAVGLPALDSMTLDEIRSLAVPVSGRPEAISRRQDFDVPRASVTGLPEESGGFAPETVPVRVYWPKTCDESAHARPGIVFFHGGGWVMGSRTVYDSLCHEIANRADSVVISVEYRLAPETPFPGGLNDAYIATHWTAEMAQELGIDSDQIVVCGDSAGGNLAAAVCLMARDRGEQFIARQVLVYPVTDCAFETRSYRENGEGFFLTRESMKWFWRQYLARPEDAAHPYCSPLRADDLAGLPAAWVMTAEYDPLRDEGEIYAQRLQEAGVDVTVTRYDGQIHGFIRRTDLFDRARDAIASIGEMIRQSASVESVRSDQARLAGSGALYNARFDASVGVGSGGPAADQV